MKLADKEVTGYCLTTDLAGIPELVERTVTRVDYDGHFLIEEPTGDGYTQVISTWTLGENFFIHLYPALLALKKRVEQAKTGKMMELAYLEDELDRCKQLIDREKEKR